MFRKRTTRNSTAYTGVSSMDNYGQKPSTNAKAAALSIGENLRKNDPATYGTSPRGSYQPPRQGQFYQSPSQQSSQGSLLKRSPSLQNSSVRATSTPKDSRQGSRSGSLLRSSFQGPPPSVNNQGIYDIDDSFTNSTFEEIGHETDAAYSNHAQLKDLHLSHSPQLSPQPRQQVKMVKKYIPGPNGVQVVEVPETSMEKAIARSNSMRTGLAIGSLQNKRTSSRPSSRTNSLTNSRSNSLSRGPPRSTSRTSSLNARSPWPRQSQPDTSLSSYRIEENVELEKDENWNQDLLKELEKERQLALDLEAKRKEYERLKELRLQNEKRMAELKKLEQEESSHSADTLSPSSAVNASDSKPDDPVVSPPPPALSQSSPIKGSGEETSDEEVPVRPVPFAVDEFEQRKLSSGEKDFPTYQNQNTTSNLELASTSTANASYDDISISRAVTANDVLNTYAAIDTSEIPEEPEDNDFGIVEVPHNEDDDEDRTTGPSHFVQTVKPALEARSQENLEDNGLDAASDGPKFDPVPEIILEDVGPADSLTPPPGANVSIKSGSSSDSRPKKSAMKNSKSNYSLNNNNINNNNNNNHNAGQSPAQQAYLSLTTAENTRLNSKLSSGQLVDQNGNIQYQEVRQGPPRSPVNQQRLSMNGPRKQPSIQQHGGLAERTLRPRPPPEVSPVRQHESMSNRTFHSHPKAQQPQHGQYAQPQPIPQHPMNQPNYQSPSKLKAAELYAKANSRPQSMQNLQRKSSYSKGSGDAGTQDEQTPPRQRFSLRPQSPPSGAGPNGAPNSNAIGGAHNVGGPPPNGMNGGASPSQNNAVGSSRTLRNGALHVPPAPSHQQQRSGGLQGFKSRFADSDDEDNGGGFSSGGFKSRFSESADNLPAGVGGSAPAASGSGAAGPSNGQNPYTLRDQEVEPVGEKPKKKKFLKKLFGRSKKE